MTVPNFPNFFMLYGPNTNLGHNSIVYMLESQIAHILRCLKTMETKGATRIEVDAEIYEDYNDNIQRRLKNTVWNGCRSWYVDANGHNSTNWPGFTVSYRAITKYAALAGYRFSGGSSAGRAGSATPFQEAA